MMPPQPTVCALCRTPLFHLDQPCPGCGAPPPHAVTAAPAPAQQFCTRCGARLTPGMATCAQCAAPAGSQGPLPQQGPVAQSADQHTARRPGWLPVAMVAAVVFAVGGVGAAAWSLLAAPQAQSSTSIEPIPEIQAEESLPDEPLPDGTRSTSAASTASPSPSTTTVAEAQQTLRERRQDSLPVMEGLRGQWVPQLSSGCAGLQVVADSATDGTQTGDVLTEVNILARHERLADRHGALTVEWFDLGSSTPDACPNSVMWVALAPDGFPNSDGALGWCTAQGYDRDNCAARLIPPTSSADTDIEYN